MVKTSLTLDKRKICTGDKYPVCVQIRDGQNRRYIRTGIFVKADQWDMEKKRVLKCPAAPAYNAALSAMEVRIENALWRNNSSGREFSFDETYSIIWEQIKETSSDEDGTSKYKWLVIFMKVIAESKNDGSKATYLRALKHIEEFIRPKRDILMDDITPSWLTRFDRHLAAEGLATNTRGIYFRDLRSVFNAAITDGITNNYPFRKFKIKSEETPKRSLTAEDMRLLFTMDVPDWIRPYLDFFLLSFLLIGINAKDLLYVRRCDIHRGRLFYKRAKTKKLYSILIPEEAWRIIDRYRGQQLLLNIMELRTDYMQFVRYVNKGLKSIGMEWTRGTSAKGRPLFPELTTYWARHTWATIAASLDIPKETIAQALGHGTRTVTDVYINFDERKVDQANYLVISHVLGKC